MEQSVIFGLLLITLGALSSSSFALPFTRLKLWSWETYWLSYSISGYLIFPILAVLIFVPGYREIFSVIPTALKWKIFIIGIIFGIGNLSFGLSLRYLGFSLGYPVAIGLMLTFGVIIPPLIDGRLFNIIGTAQGDRLFTGIFIILIGIILVAITGILKDRDIQTKSEIHLTKGFICAILVGLAGSTFSLGLEQGFTIRELTLEAGSDPLFADNTTMLIMLVGTILSTTIAVSVNAVKKGYYREFFTLPKLLILKNSLFCLLAGMLWFNQFFLFTMGKSYMGELSFVAWGVLMALIIVFGTLWGVIRGEWRGTSRKNYTLLTLSLIIIVTATLIIGTAV